MSPTPEVLSAAADDAYKNRSPNDVDDRVKLLNLGGHEYTVFGYKNDSVTGFHATAYREVAPPHNIIIAYRGTDPDFKHHGLTTAQDALVDATMVRDKINPQEPAARAFTQAMIDKAARDGIGTDQITVAGHSLGGTLAEIESWRFGLGGATFNAYGAAGLGYEIPEGGTRLTNYVMAGDLVSAASPHYGKVFPLASDDDVQALRAGHYLAATGMSQRNPFLAMRLADHSHTHFAPMPGSGETSVLSPGKFARYAQNYAEHKAAFDAFRADAQRERGELAAAFRTARRDHTDVVLPADVQRQLDEYLAVNADPAIRQAIEENRWIRGTEYRLRQGAGMVDVAGVLIQHQDERTAALARRAGAQITAMSPSAPVAGLALGEVLHLHGLATRATTRFLSESIHAAEHVIRQDAHAIAQTAEAALHSPALQNKISTGVNHLVDAYRGAESFARTLAETYGDMRGAVSQGMDATERIAGDAYAAIHHFGERGDAQGVPDRATSGNPALRGFSDPAHPQHAMYSALEKLLPQGTSEARLSQATAACCQAGVSDPKDIERIYVTRKAAIFLFKPMWATTAQVDLTRPAPPVEQTVQQVQLLDRQRAHMQAQTHNHLEAQVQQGPVR